MKIISIITFLMIFIAPTAFACNQKSIDELSYIDKESLITFACQSNRYAMENSKELREAVAQQIKLMNVPELSNMYYKNGIRARENYTCNSSNYENSLNFLKKEYGVRDTFWQKLMKFDSSNYWDQLLEKDTRKDSEIFLEKYCKKST